MDILINITFPIFAIIAVGYLAGHWKILGQESGVALNRFVYLFALPSALFVFTARAQVADILNWPFIGTFVLGTVLTLLIALGVGWFLFRHRGATLTLHGLSAVFPNVTFIGLPLFLTTFGEARVMPPIIATLCSILLLVGGTITALEFQRNREVLLGQALAEVAATLIRNPLLVAVAAGFVFSVLSVPVPKPFEIFFNLMAATAAPAALFALGLALVDQPILAEFKEVCWLVVLKLVAQPVITYWLAVYVFPVDPFWAKSAVILAALPGASTAFVLAQEHNVYVRRSSASIVLSTVISVLTLSVLLAFLDVRG